MVDKNLSCILGVNEKQAEQSVIKRSNQFERSAYIIEN